MPETVTRAVQVVVSAEKKGDVGAPFKELEKGATSASQTVRRRLGEIQDRLKEIGSVRGQAKEFGEQFFGISQIDKSLARLQNVATDRLTKIRQQFAKGADEGAMLTSIRRLQGDVAKLGTMTESATGAMMTSFGRAAAGATDLGRSIVLLTEGDKGFEELARGVAKFEGALALLRGGKELLVGLVGGVVNLKRAWDAMSAAKTIAEGVAAAQLAMSGATLAGAKATDTAGAAHVRATTAADAHAGAVTRVVVAYRGLLTMGAGAGAGMSMPLMLPGPGGQGVAAAPAAVPAIGGRLGWAGRGLIGAGVGGVAADAAGFNPWVGAGIGGGVGAAAPWIGRGLAAGAGALGMGKLAGFGGALAGGTAKAGAAGIGMTSAAVLLPALIGTELIDRVMTGGRGGFGSVFRARAGAADAEAKTVRMTERQQRRVAREREMAEFFQTQAPFREQQRAFQIERDLMTDQATGLGAVGGMAEREERRIRQALRGPAVGGDPRRLPRLPGARSDAFFSSVFAGPGREGRAGRDFLRAQGEHLDEAARIAGRNTAEADVRVWQTGREVGRATSEVAGIQKQIRAWEQRRDFEVGADPREQQATVAKLLDLQEQLAAASERQKKAIEAQNTALRDRRQASVEELQIEKDKLKARLEFARQAAAQAREKMEGGLEQFGAMTPEKRMMMLDATRRLARGERLDPELADMARGAGLGIGELQRKSDLQHAERDPVVQAIMQLTGVKRDVDRKEEAVVAIEKGAVAIQNEINVTVKAEEAEMAKRMTDAVVPMFQKLMQQVEARLKAQMQAEAILRTVATVRP